jgi:hypothetical protein
MTFYDVCRRHRRSEGGRANIACAFVIKGEDKGDWDAQTAAWRTYIEARREAAA